MLSLTGCFFLSALMLDANSLLEYDFYRRDGNFFVAWAPLLLLSRVQYRIDVARILRWFIVISAVISAGAIIAWKLGRLRPGTSEFFHLFYAHNAAGGFLAVVCGYSIAHLHRQGWKWVWGRCTAGRWFGSDSLTREPTRVWARRGDGLPCPKTTRLDRDAHRCSSTAGVLHYGYKHSKGIIDYGDATSWNAPAELGLGRAHTLSGRIYGLWPRGVHTWLKSPIVGTGFGSYNDAPHRFSGRDGVLMWSQGPKVHSDAHAHHSYVHVLAETGIVGLALLVWFLTCVYRTILIHQVLRRFVQLSCLASGRLFLRPSRSTGLLLRQTFCLLVY